MARQAFVVGDLDPAQPKLLARDQAMDIVSQAGADRRQSRHEILRESEFGEPLMPANKRDVLPGCAQHLRIVTGQGFAFPAVMGGEDRVEAKRLRCLHASQRLAIGGAVHDPVAVHRETVDHRQHGDGAGVFFERRYQAVGYLLRKIRARRVMDQDILRRSVG